VRKLTTKEFITRSRLVHGDLYDYSSTNYINMRTKLTIIDPKHGPWEQLPYSHLSGLGHRKRSGQKAALKLAKTTEDFIARSRLVHGDLYDYSLVEYVRADDKVIIIDPEKGPWYQRPSSHLI
jgi:serine/threonine-protein kinase RIO1